MLIPLMVLALVFILTAVRQVGGFRLQIWQIMLAGALAVLALGQISLSAALASINADVMLFLFGMFVLGQALEESGYLAHISYHLFRRAKSVDQLLFLLIFCVGASSAFLMNDTLAIVGTPVVLLLARRYGLGPKPLLLALAFAVTIGSVASPIGNPQNLLIALDGGIASPFVSFFSHLLAPTLLNLLAAFILLKILFKDELKDRRISHQSHPLEDASLARLCRVSLAVLVVLVAAKIGSYVIFGGPGFRLTYIALAAAAPVVLFSPKRVGIVRRADWATLVFFASMFVLMESVWLSGFFQGALGDTGLDVSSTPAILAISVVLSQFVSNVPLVALYLPMLMHSGASLKAFMALAAGSTIAGNLTILGAASNVIIIHNAEKRSKETITFMDFAKVGVPLTLVNIAVYWLFL